LAQRAMPSGIVPRPRGETPSCRRQGLPSHTIEAMCDDPSTMAKMTGE
jgi:hypothetical protein